MDSSLVAIVKAWQASGRKCSLWEFLVFKNKWIFSHHPASDLFSEHVWCFQGLFFCKGCVMTVVGWIVAIVIQLSTDWLRIIAINWLAAVFALLLLPSVVTAFLKGPRFCGHITRVLLGVVVVSSIWLFVITELWWVRIVLLVVYLAVKIPLGRYRRRKNEQILKADVKSKKYGNVRRALRHKC